MDWVVLIKRKYINLEGNDQKVFQLLRQSSREILIPFCDQRLELIDYTSFSDLVVNDQSTLTNFLIFFFH